MLSFPFSLHALSFANWYSDCLPPHLSWFSDFRGEVIPTLHILHNIKYSLFVDFLCQIMLQANSCQSISKSSLITIDFLVTTHWILLNIWLSYSIIVTLKLEADAVFHGLMFWFELYWNNWCSISNWTTLDVLWLWHELLLSCFFCSLIISTSVCFATVVFYIGTGINRSNACIVCSYNWLRLVQILNLMCIRIVTHMLIIRRTVTRSGLTRSTQ